MNSTLLPVPLHLPYQTDRAGETHAGADHSSPLGDAALSGLGTFARAGARAAAERARLAG